MKSTSIIALGALAAILLSGATGNRKVTQNKLSPPADTTVQVGGHAVTIEYNAPSARERKVEGGLVPYGKVWRLGADAATTLTTEGDIMIGNLRVPKGIHTLYIMASEGDWKLIVNKQTGQWGTQYSDAQDLGRVDLTLSKTSQPVEKLNITLKPAGGNAATLEIEWGGTRATVPVKAA